MRRAVIPFLTMLLIAPATAAKFTLDIPGGRFEDCEWIGLGETGALNGAMTIDRTYRDERWAPMVAIVLLDDRRPGRSFRLSLVNIADSRKLLLRTEVVIDDDSIVTEDIAKSVVGARLPYAIAWNADGVVDIATIGVPRREIRLGFRPNRAFLLVSGAHGTIESRRHKIIDCSRAIESTDTGGG